MSIRPFSIAVPDEVLADLARRLDATIWPQTLDDAGWDYGTDIAELRASSTTGASASIGARAKPSSIVSRSSWSSSTARRSTASTPARGTGRSRCMPLVLTHGWPSTFYELTALVEPLTAAGFDVVVPSLPGYGFSSPPTRRGFGAGQVADLWVRVDGEARLSRASARMAAIGARR